MWPMKTIMGQLYGHLKPGDIRRIREELRRKCRKHEWSRDFVIGGWYCKNCLENRKHDPRR